MTCGQKERRLQSLQISRAVSRHRSARRGRPVSQLPSACMCPRPATLSGGAAGFGPYQGWELCCSGEQSGATSVFLGAVGREVVRGHLCVPRGSGQGSLDTWPPQVAGLPYVPCPLLRGQNRLWAGRQAREVFCARSPHANLRSKGEAYMVSCSDGG